MGSSFVWAVVLVVCAAATAAEADTRSKSPVGVCFPLKGTNLPPADRTAELLHKYKIPRTMVFAFNNSVMRSLRTLKPETSVAVMFPNEHLKSQDSVVRWWLSNYVDPYLNEVDINYIVVGDKAVQDNSADVLRVMKAVRRVLDKKILGRVKVTTLFDYDKTMNTPYPPSRATFIQKANNDISDILRFLRNQGAPLMVSVYPYWGYVHNRLSMHLDFALFKSKKPVLTDTFNVKYYNLLDAMVDAFYRAMERVGVSEVPIVIGEIGWPTAGGEHNVTTTQNAAIFNQNLLKHLEARKGTPKKPQFAIEAYIRSLYDEKDKSIHPSYQSFGIFETNGNPKYPLFKKSSN
ncbi:hypothetical protein ACFX19_034044 [Malus domestica]